MEGEDEIKMKPELSQFDHVKNHGLSFREAGGVDFKCCNMIVDSADFCPPGPTVIIRTTIDR